MAHNDDFDDDSEPLDDFEDLDEDAKVELMVDDLFFNQSLRAIQDLPAAFRQPGATEEELLAGLAEYSEQRHARAAALQQSVDPARMAQLKNDLLASIDDATERFGVKDDPAEPLRPVKFLRCGPDEVRVVTVAGEELRAHWEPQVGYVPLRFGTERYVVGEPLEAWVARCRMTWPAPPRSLRTDPPLRAARRPRLQRNPLSSPVRSESLLYPWRFARGR